MTSKKSNASKSMFPVGLKAIAYVLAFLLVLYAVPTNVYAEIIDAVDSALDGTSDNVDELGSAESEVLADKAVFEVIDRREETVKHFRDADGSYVAAQYDYPVHELDSNGKWQDIDNTLAESGSEYATPNARVKFAKKITGSETLFTLHDGNRKITMSMTGANKKVAGQVTNTHTEFDTEATKLQKMMALDKLSSRILYPEILNDVDLEYVVQPDSIKENIIVKEKGDEYRYSFDIRLNNLAATLQEDGSVCIADPDTNEVVYVIPAGYMFDGAGEYSDAVQYELADNGSGKYALTVTADAEWINSEERVFPVTIDPTISHKANTASDVQIYYKSSDYTKTTSNTVIHVGDYNRLYWQSNLPSLPNGVYIVNAWLSFYSDYGSTDYLTAHLVTESVPSVTGRFPNAQGIGTPFRCLDYQQYSEISTSGRWFSWNITEAVNSWYNGANNYGICIYNYENLDPVRLRSYESSVLALRPQFIITYRDISGIESYWSYVSQDAGVAGSGAVNQATGELTYSLPTLSMTDHLFGYTPSLIYQSSNSMCFNTTDNYLGSPFKDSATARGWRLSTDVSVTWQSVQMHDGSEYTIYTYMDSDGTAHNFTFAQSDIEASDEDGLGLKMHRTLDGASIKIVDASFSEQVFQVYSSNSYINEGALLSYVSDSVGNKIKFNRNSYGHITTIGLVPKGLSEITFLTFSYNAGGYLSQIADSTYSRYVSFEYSYEPNGDKQATYGDYLRSVKYSHVSSGGNRVIDVIVDYTYSYVGEDNNGNDMYCLTQALDKRSKQSIIYTYNSNGKVTEVTEYASNSSVKGQAIQLSYYTGYTEVRTSGKDDILFNSDDIKTRSIFDGFGRVVNAYSTNLSGDVVYGASGGTYENANQDSSQTNKIKTSVVTGSVSPNLIVNGNFDCVGSSTVPYWNCTSSSNIWLSNYSAMSLKEVVFAPKYNQQDSIYQYVYLSKGTYTLSFDYLPICCENVEILVQVQSTSNSSEVYSKKLATNLDYAVERIYDSLSFDVTSSSGGTYKISFCVKGLTSDCTVAAVSADNFMLERAIGPGSYNMIQFGNFENFSRSSNSATLYTPAQFWTIASNVSPSSISGGELSLSSGPKNNATATQIIYQSSSSSFMQSGSYIVSGYATSSNAVYSNTAIFALRAEVTYRNDNGTTFVEKFSFDFTPSIETKQFVTGSFVIDSTKVVKEIRIICDFSNQIGTATFDNISVVRSTGDGVTEYEYYTQNDGANKAGKIKIQRTPNESITYGYDYFTGNLDYYEIRKNGVMSSSVTLFHNDSNLLEEQYLMRFDSAGNYVDETATEYSYNAYGMKVLEETYVISENSSGAEVQSLKLRTTYGYDTTSSSHIFGALLSETDTSGNTKSYRYDDCTGWLKCEYSSGYYGLYYTYDELGRVIAVNPLTYSNSTYAPNTSAERANYTYDSLGQLSQISTATTTYSYTHDAFGNTTSVKIGGNSLVQYEYDNYNGKLKKITYSTGISVRYVYDELDRIEEVWYTTNGTETCRYRYTYTDLGDLAKVEDLVINQETLCQYDALGNLVGYVIVDSSTDVVVGGFKYLYDSENRLIEREYGFDCEIDSEYISNYLTENYYYDGDTLSQYEVSLNFDTTVQIDYVYDNLNRLSQKVNTYENFTNNIQYTYRNIDSTKTTLQVSQYKSTIGNTSVVRDNYTYDSRGNITQITNKNGKIIKYTYDDQNQLTREDNQLLGKTYVYAYDNAGNRTSVKTYSYTTGSLSSLTYTETTYTYGNSAWRDQLTKVGSTSIAYDALGNPKSYNDFTLTWEGRQLKRMQGSSSGNYFAFEYNEAGLRTRKNARGISHYYTWEGSTLVSEEWRGHWLVFLYDESGSPIGLKYRQSSYADGEFDTFYFVKNMQGDIVAIYNESGTLIGSYTYDAWGNCTATVESGNTSLENSIVKNYNPFRYRGYYYDYETSMYYLQSRYYVPAWGRFLNADKFTSTGTGLLGFNMYAYCDNNPVMFVDYTGEIVITATTVAVFIATVVISATSNAISTYVSGGTATDCLIAGGIGAAAGVISGLVFVFTGGVYPGINVLGRMASSAFCDILTPLCVNGQVTQTDWGYMGIDVIMDACLSTVTYYYTDGITDKLIENSLNGILDGLSDIFSSYIFSNKSPLSTQNEDQEIGVTSEERGFYRVKYAN